MAEPTAVPVCPKCHAVMVLRHRRTDEAPFWGCSRFPDCRSIVNIAPPQPGTAAIHSVSPPIPAVCRQTRAMPTPSGPATDRASRLTGRVWFAFLFDAIAIVCAVAFLATADGRWAMLFIGVLFLAIAVLSALTAPFLSPRLASRIAFDVMGLALLGAFGVFALVPLSMWFGQIWAHDLIQAMPTLPPHTPSLLP
jgi:hypothetical protein